MEGNNASIGGAGVNKILSVEELQIISKELSQFDNAIAEAEDATSRAIYQLLNMPIMQSYKEASPYNESVIRKLEEITRVFKEYTKGTEDMEEVTRKLLNNHMAILEGQNRY